MQLFDSLTARGFLTTDGDLLSLTPPGRTFVEAFGIDLDGLARGRAPLCRGCLDWSERRTHLAGSLGRAFLSRFEADGWARRDRESRAVRFTPDGLRRFEAAFPAG